MTSGIIYAYMHKIGSNGFPAEDKIKSNTNRMLDESESSKYEDDEMKETQQQKIHRAQNMRSVKVMLLNCRKKNQVK